jgi:hypothetical protein
MKQRRDTWDYKELWLRKHPARIEGMFEDQLNSILKIGQGIDTEEVQEDPDDLMNCVQRRMIYLGTIMNMTPSGKVYTPWANSNVSVKEAALDEVWREYMDRELERNNLSLEQGEGDYCDIFLVRYYDLPDRPEEWEDEDEWEREEIDWENREM